MSTTQVNYAQDATVDTVLFQGNNRTKSSYLQHFTSFHKGSEIDSLALNEDLRRLRALPSVMFANYTIEQTEHGTQLSYNVIERYTLFPVGDFGITDNSFWIGGGAMESNLLGRGLYAYGYYQYNTKSTWHLIFRNPYLSGSKLGTELQFRKMPSVEPYPNNLGDLHIDFLNISLAARYEFRPENELWMGTSYRKESFVLEVNTAFLQPVIMNSPVERKSQEIYLRYNRRRLNYEDFYISGWKNVVHTSFLIPFKKQFDEVFTLLDEFTYYKRFGNTGNLALRAMLGLSSEKWAAFQPFIADSYLNFRGIGYRAYRGNVSVLLNVEYRQTIWENRWGGIQAVLFSDNGILGTHDTFFKLLPSSPESYWQTFGGFGLRFIYKKAYDAILCIDYGFNLQDLPNGGWVLGWGQYF